MALANIIASLIMGGDAEKERRKREDFEAKGLANWGAPQVEQEWKYRNAGAGDLTSSNVATGRLTFANPQQAARYNPEMFNYVQRHNAQFDTAGPLSDKESELARRKAIYNLDTEKQLAPGKRELAIGDAQALFTGQRSYNPEFNNKMVEEESRAPFVKDISSYTADTKQRQAEDALREQKRLQLLDYATQKANQTYASSKNAELGDRVSIISRDELLKQEDPIRYLTRLGVQDDTARLAYGKRPEGYVLDDKGKLTYEPALQESGSGSGDVLDTAAAGLGKSRNMTSRGFAGGIAPTARPTLTAKQLFNAIMAQRPKTPLAEAVTAAPALQTPVAPVTNAPAGRPPNMQQTAELAWKGGIVPAWKKGIVPAAKKAGPVIVNMWEFLNEIAEANKRAAEQQSR
jgi:hypothetical protein